MRRFNARAIVLEQRHRQEDQEMGSNVHLCTHYTAAELKKRHAAEWDALRKEFGLHN